MNRAASYLIALTLALSIPLLDAPSAFATTNHSPRLSPQADIFNATTRVQGNPQSGTGKTAPASKGKEVPSMRSQNSITTATSRGYVTDIYGHSIHYKDASGNWQPIDDTLVPAATQGFAVKNKANSYTALLPSSLSLPARFLLPSGAIDFALSGAAGTMTENGATARYSNALSGVTVSYAAEPDSLKETITLANVQAPTTFTYTFRLPTGWLARTNSHAGIDILDSKGVAQATLRAPFMFDASHQVPIGSGGVALTLASAGGIATITVAADRKWINAPGRAFPVTIDPSIWTNTTYYGGYDCYLQQALPTTTACAGFGYAGTTDSVGYDGTNLDRGLEYFPVQWNYVHIVPNSNILDVELDMTLASSSSSAAVPVTLFPMTSSWNPNGVTWNNSGADGGVPWNAPGGDYGSAISTVNVGPAAGPYAWYGLTQTVQNWVNGSGLNNGFLLRAATESQVGMLQFDNQNFDTGNPVDPSNPHMRVQWNAWGGLQPWFTNETRQLDDRMSIAVNVANGQLVVHNQDLAVRGVGQDLFVDRYYNSLSDLQWHLGNGWNLNIGCDVQIDIDDHDGVIYKAPDGYQVLFRNNGSGGYVTPPGINADLVKNADGTFTLTFRGSGLKYTFQAGGCLQNEVDRNGNTLSMSYNGSLQTITDTESRATTFAYTSPVSSDFITQITDSANRTYQYSYDSNGNLVTYTDANGKLTHYAYNANNQMSQIADPNGNIVNFSYSTQYPQPLSQLSIASASCPSGTCNTTFAYSTGNGPCTSVGIVLNTVVTDAKGLSTTYCSDSQGRVVEARDASNHSRLAAYSANNDVVSVTDALSAMTQFSYDSTNNLIGVRYPPSAPGQTPGTFSFRYQAPGQQFLASSTTDSLGNCRALFYDASGNVTSAYDGQASPCDGRASGASYCEAYQGNPTGTCGSTSSVSCSGARPGELCWEQDGNANRTSYAYDANGNLTSAIPPLPLGQTHVAVDSLSRPISITDGKGQTTSLSYDSLDRIVQILFNGATTCSSGAVCTTIQWDADGNLVSRTDSGGTTGFVYDGLNRLTMKSLPDTSSSCPGQSGITMAYDPASNLIQYCDSGGAVSFGYDSLNRMTSLAEPGGTCSGTPNLCTTYGYDNNGRLLTETFPGGAKQTFAYDSVGNAKSVIGADSSGHVVTSFTYAYAQGTQDLNSRLSMTENDPLANLTTNYTYDGLDRLTKAANSQSTLSYSYDAAGNRTSAPTGASTFNNANEITSSPASNSYSFDANGNLSGSGSGGSLSYNSQNQTTSATWSGQTVGGMSYAGMGQSERLTAGTATFSSGPMGLAISRTAGSSTYFLRDAFGQVLGERTPDGSHWYYLKDAIGSVVAVINGAGSIVANRYAYDPYGIVTYSSGSVPNPWGYAGGYTDPTGLVKFGSRFYDPNLGRFTQVEPSAPTPSYSYAADNPINVTDPSGNVLVCGGGCGGDAPPPGGYTSPPPPISSSSSGRTPATRVVTMTANPNPIGPTPILPAFQPLVKKVIDTASGWVKNDPGCPALKTEAGNWFKAAGVFWGVATAVGGPAPEIGLPAATIAAVSVGSGLFIGAWGALVPCQ